MAISRFASLFDQLPSNKRLVRFCLWGASLSVLLSRLYLLVIRPIQFFDESLYLAQTNGLIKYGAIPPWSGNPSVTVLNALWFMPLHDVAMGLDYASRIGMFLSECIIFGLLVWIARALFHSWWWQLFIIALALVAAPFWSTSQNSTDSYYTLFVILGFFALWRALHHPPTHRVWVGVATILAISGSIRNDGLLVFATATVIYGVYLLRSSLSWRQRIITGIRWFLPFGCVVLVYWGLIFRGGGAYFAYGDSVKMEFDGATLGERTYLAFEQGEGYARRFDLIKEGKAWWVEGPKLTDALYGTREENHNSVLMALTRNPSAWLNRLKWNVRDFFLGWHEAFTLHALPLFLVALWGWGLAWRHHWRLALAVLIILAPTVVYFLLTFWNYRYVTFLAPVWFVLATYLVYTFYSLPRVSDFRWNLLIAVITGIGGILFIDAVEGRSVPIPLYTLLIAGSLYGMFLWRFVSATLFPQKLVTIGTWVVVVGVLIGAFSPFPPATTASSRPQIEIRSYLLNVYEFYRDKRVCVNISDLGATSLAWHARQIPVFITETTMASAAEEGELAELFEERACRFGLQTGSVEEHLRIMESTPHKVLFLPGEKIIFFFEIKND